MRLRIYGWRRFVPALLHGVSYNERQHPAYYRRWPISVRFAWPRRPHGIPVGLHGIQCGSKIIPSSQGAYITSARVYRTALRIGPLLILFGPDRCRLDGHPEDIAEWVWQKRRGEIVGLLNTHAYTDHVTSASVRRDLRRVIEEVTH